MTNNDKISLFSTALLALFFFVVGLLDLLDNFIVRMILFLGFIGIVINIIIIKARSSNTN